MSEEKDLIITLDNEKKYIYLVELDDFKSYIIGEVENDEVTEVEDKNLLGQLLIEFSKKV